MKCLDFGDIFSVSLVLFHLYLLLCLMAGLLPHGYKMAAVPPGITSSLKAGRK